MTTRKKITSNRPDTISSGFSVQLENDCDPESNDSYYKTLIENLTDLILILDEDRKIKFTSPSISHLLGYKARWLSGKQMDDIVHADDRKALRSKLKTLLDKEDNKLNCELRIQEMDGKWKTFEVTGTNLIDYPLVSGIFLHLHDITGRKLKEDALKQTEERYRLVANNVTDVIFITDMNMKFTYFSPSVTRSRGHTPEEAMTMDIRESLTPESVEACINAFAEELALEQQEEKDLNRTRVMEVEMIHKNGSTFWVEVKFNFIRDEDGTPTGILGVSRNIDERKRTEEALRRSEQKFRLMFESSPEAILLVDREGTIIDANNKLYDLLGYKLEDCINENLHYINFLTQDSKERLMKNITDRMNGIDVGSLELTLIHRNGEQRIGLVHANTIQGGEKKNTYNLIMISDITDLKEAVQTSKRRTQEILTLQKTTTSIQSTLELEEVLQLISEAVVVNLGFDHVLLFLSNDKQTVTRATVFHTNGDSRLVGDVESALSQTLTSIEIPLIKGFSRVVDNGLAKKETIVHHISDIAHPPFSKEECNYVQELLGARTIINVPFFARDKHVGNIVAFTSSDYISEDEVEILWLLADHTAIAIENAMLNEELEHRVVERTAQLQAANNELERFAYSLAHDLRTPLRGIDGFSQVLIEDYMDVLDDEGKGYLERVRSATQRMSRLIDDILHLLHITRSTMHIETVELTLVANEIIVKLQAKHSERLVETTIAPNIKAQGDSQLLKEVLSELINNAWKFTGKQSSARIEIGSADINGQIAYFVRDNGVGFDMTYVDKIFAAFQRLHGMNDFEGTGIGLAKVQRIVHRHGGRIWAESTVNGGTIFYFTLWTEEETENSAVGNS